MRPAVLAIAATSGPALGRLIDEHLAPDEDPIRSLLLIGVVVEPGAFVATFAPMSGLVTPEGMRALAVEEAAKVARDAVDRVPAQIAVRHCVCGGWSQLPELLVSQGCQGAIVAEGDPSRRRLRSIRASAGRLGFDLIVGSKGPGRTALLPAPRTAAVPAPAGS